MATTNAFILHLGWSGSSNGIAIKKFLIELAKEIIGGYCSRRRGGRNVALIKPLPLSHFPVKKLQHLTSSTEVVTPNAIGIRRDHTPTGTGRSVAYGCATQKPRAQTASYHDLRT